MDEYNKVKRIGAGSQGTCYLLQHINTQKQYVCKKIKLENSHSQIKNNFKNVEVNLNERNLCINELNLLQKISPHKNLISYYKAIVENNWLNIIMEYADGGDLSTEISRRIKILNEVEKDKCLMSNSEYKFRLKKAYFTENQIMYIFIQILLGLNHLHSNKIMHRDIKLQNIFLTKDGYVKLGDLGIAKEIKDNECANTVVGSPIYMAPEVFNNVPYNNKSDVWALGCLLYEIVALKPLFNANNVAQIYCQILNLNNSSNLLNTHSFIYTKQLTTLISIMLQQNPSARPTTSYLLQLPYIQDELYKIIKQNQNLDYLKQAMINNSKLSSVSFISLFNDTDNILSQSKTNTVKILSYKHKTAKILGEKYNSCDFNNNQTDSSRLIAKNIPWNSSKYRRKSSNASFFTNVSNAIFKPGGTIFPETVERNEISGKTANLYDLLQNQLS